MPIYDDIQWLLDNPEGSMGSTYHDAGSCWELINALVNRLRDAEGAVAAETQRCAALLCVCCSQGNPRIPHPLRPGPWTHKETLFHTVCRAGALFDPPDPPEPAQPKEKEDA